VIIDRKFKFVAVNPCNGKHYTQEDAVVFCAKDKALIPALERYAEECRVIGSNPEHIESVLLLVGRVKDYQAAFGARVPDTVGDCELARCIDGYGVER